jgi:hypothetical protein
VIIETIRFRVTETVCIKRIVSVTLKRCVILKRNHKKMSSAIAKRYKRLRSELTGESKTDLTFIQEDRCKAWTMFHTTKKAVIQGLIEVKNEGDETAIKAVVKVAKRSDIPCSICFEKYE